MVERTVLKFRLNKLNRVKVHTVVLEEFGVFDCLKFFLKYTISEKKTTKTIMVKGQGC